MRTGFYFWGSGSDQKKKIGKISSPSGRNTRIRNRTAACCPLIILLFVLLEPSLGHPSTWSTFHCAFLYGPQSCISGSEYIVSDPDLIILYRTRFRVFCTEPGSAYFVSDPDPSILYRTRIQVLWFGPGSDFFLIGSGSDYFVSDQKPSILIRTRIRVFCFGPGSDCFVLDRDQIILYRSRIQAFCIGPGSRSDFSLIGPRSDFSGRIRLHIFRYSFWSIFGRIRSFRWYPVYLNGRFLVFRAWAEFPPSLLLNLNIKSFNH